VIFFDTNILVYASVNLDEDKLQKSQSLIEQAQKANLFLVSSLLLQEYAFVLSKLKLNKTEIFYKTQVFSEYCQHEIDCSLLKEAFELAS
jgi:predicted nucleic acid-binding protein